MDGRGDIDAGELICHWMDILSREKLHFSLLLSCFWQPCEYVMISFIVGLFSFAVESLWNVVGSFRVLVTTDYSSLKSKK